MAKIKIATEESKTAFDRDQESSSIRFATTTSSREIVEVSAVKISRTKKTVDTISVPGSLSNKIGSVLKTINFVSKLKEEKNEY